MNDKWWFCIPGLDCLHGRTNFANPILVRVVWCPLSLEHVVNGGGESSWLYHIENFGPSITSLSFRKPLKPAWVSSRKKLSPTWMMTKNIAEMDDILGIWWMINWGYTQYHMIRQFREKKTKWQWKTTTRHPGHGLRRALLNPHIDSLGKMPMFLAIKRQLLSETWRDHGF